MTKKFLALTMVLVLAAGFAAVSAEPPQTFSEKLSVGMHIESNSVRTLGVNLNVPMYGGSTRFAFGSGTVKKEYGPYHEKQSYLHFSGIFYPEDLSWESNLKNTALPSFLKPEKDYYQARVGFGGKIFTKAIKSELFTWNLPNLYGGLYGGPAAEVRVPLDVTSINFLESWNVVTGYQMAPGIITEPPYLDVRSALFVGLNYDF